MKRIVIVDDSQIMRKTLKGLLSGAAFGMDVCGEAAETAEALGVCQDCRPDLVMVDLSVPSHGAVEFARALGEKVPGAKVIIMSAQDAHTLARLEEGCGIPCVAKSDLLAQLIPAMHRAMGRRPAL